MDPGPKRSGGRMQAPKTGKERMDFFWDLDLWQGGREVERLDLARVVTNVVAMAELLLRLHLAPRPFALLLFASSSSSSSSSISPSPLQYRPCFHPHRNNNLLSIQRHRSSSTACSVSRRHAEKGSLKNRGRRALPFRVLFTLSAAAALVFLRRRRTLQQAKARELMAFRKEEEGTAALAVPTIDTHLHVWASPEESKKYPYFPGQEPTIPGSAEDLLKCMAEAGVDGAVIVQPINHKFDHSYVSSVLQKYPSKFVGCCLADPTDGGGGVKELQRLVEDEGYRAVRFNPYLWPSGQKMTNEVGKAMFAKAGELGVPVGFMCFKGLMLHIDEIEELCKEFPTTKVLIDHLGFCRPPKNVEEEDALKHLLGLSRFPQVYVKLSAFFRVSREPFPYKDTWQMLKQLLDTYGADRLMWGSDFPFVTTECGYTNAWHVLPPANLNEAFFSEKEVKACMGGTAVSLFKGGWKNHSSGL